MSDPGRQGPTADTAPSGLFFAIATINSRCALMKLSGTTSRPPLENRPAIACSTSFQFEAPHPRREKLWPAFPVSGHVAASWFHTATRVQGGALSQLNLDRVRKERVTPFVERPHKIRLGMDCQTFAIKPFSSVGIERKMPNVIVAGLLPMLDRQ